MWGGGEVERRLVISQLRESSSFSPSPSLSSSLLPTSSSPHALSFPSLLIVPCGSQLFCFFLFSLFSSVHSHPWFRSAQPWNSPETGKRRALNRNCSFATMILMIPHSVRPQYFWRATKLSTNLRVTALSFSPAVRLNYLPGLHSNPARSAERHSLIPINSSSYFISRHSLHFFFATIYTLCSATHIPCNDHRGRTSKVFYDCSR